MTLRAALLCATLALGGPAAADIFWEVDRFDVTGILPEVFDPDGQPSASGDGWTYRAHDGGAELLVFGNHNLSDLQTDRELTRQGLLARGATILVKEMDLDSYVYSGVEQDGWAFYRFTRQGATCDGEGVLGSFVLRYSPEHAETYAPLIDALRSSFHIGACG